MERIRKLNELSIDELYSIAVLLDYEDLLRFCSSSSRINNLICKKNDIWRYRLSKDFPKSTLKNGNDRTTYEELYRLIKKVREIYDLSLTLSLSNFNFNYIIDRIKKLESYGYFSSELSNIYKETRYNIRNFIIKHIIDNTDGRLMRNSIPIIGIRQFLEYKYGIDWDQITK